MSFTDIFQALLDFFVKHEGAVLLLSTIFSLIPWLVMLSLLRRFNISQLDEWASPFAWAFFVLAVTHAIGLLVWTLKPYFAGTAPPNCLIVTIGAGLAICSSLSNYLFLRSGSALTKESKAARSKILDAVHIRPIPRIALILVIFFLVSIISLADVWWLRIPDVLLSVGAIVFVGIALSRNIFRRGRFMALLALLTTFAYAALFISYAFHPQIAKKGWADWIKVAVAENKSELKTESEIKAEKAGEVNSRIHKMDLFVISLSLPLKLGLFLPGYILMLMIGSPARIRELYEDVTDGLAEFLDDNGVVESMKDEIKADLIELYIKLPRKKRYKATRYSCPPMAEMIEKPEELTFDKTTDFGYVMRSGERFLFRLVNYSNEGPEDLQESISELSSVIVLPILFHNTVVGCLKAVLNDGNFNVADMQNMQRFASLLSPAVQDYREVDGLNEISRGLTRLQIEAKEYKISYGVKMIAKISRRILGSSATCISIEAGFYPEHDMKPAKAENDTEMQLLLKAPYAELKPIHRKGEFKYLPEILQITSRELMDAGITEGTHFFGRYILKTPIRLDKNNLPTLANKPVHRRAVSNLIMEALLNFVRGSLNEVSRDLAVGLNGLKKPDRADGNKDETDTIRRWFTMVETMARKADLRWVVATHPKEQGWLGQEQELVRDLEQDESGWKTKKVYTEYANIQAIELYTLKPGGNTTHIIRLSFSETRQQMWMGVSNPNFSMELDYLSPWSGFIHRFGEIADTALQQILNRREREKEVANKARRRQIEDSKFERASIAHRMVNVVRKVTDPLEIVVSVVKSLKGIRYEEPKRMANDLSKDVARLKKLAGEFANVAKHDAHISCSLHEIVKYASEDLQDRLATFDFDIALNGLGFHTVGVPLNVAKNALIALLENAIEAPRAENEVSGRIQISAEKEGDIFLCHVTDNGIGVPQHILPRIIDYEVPSTKHGGSGIGLSQSADYLRQYDSNIRLTRSGLDTGTTFTLCFSPPRED